MGIRGGQSLTFRATGVSDTIDASNAEMGAMAILKDLVPNPTTAAQFVPRPASTQITNFAAFTDPEDVSVFLVVGNRVYGMIASDNFPGQDVPFCYDLDAGAFVTVAGATAANTPDTQLTSGDWSPPTMAMTGKRIMITHPGFDGAPNYVGWIDTRGFISTGATGDTHTSTLIDNLSSNPLTILGVQVGDKVTGSGIPADTFVVSLNATSVTLSQATTTTVVGAALTFTSGTFLAPQYGAGNTNTTPLVAVPAAVSIFNGRAYYAVDNGLQFSDSLKPLEITAATQALTLGDETPVTAIAGLPLGNLVQGGVVQSLIAFKGAAPYWQVLGDPATSDLKLDLVDGSVGTLAPRSLAPMTNGLGYIAPDGFRIINLDGKASEPIGANGQGVNVPFTYAVNPSRIAAAYNQNIYRASVQNGYVDGQPFEEYWFDFSRGAWTGPHSFPATMIAPYYAVNNAFIMAGVGLPAKLWESTTKPSANSTYTENGVAMSFIWQSSLLPDNEQTANTQVIQTALGLVMPPTQALTVIAMSEVGQPLGLVSLDGGGASSSVWDAFDWGEAVWGSSLTPYQQYNLPWPNPLVFKQMMLRITGASLAGFAIGNLYFNYQITGYFGAH